MKRKPNKKQCKKLYDGKCFICDESNYNLLDSHRIVEGSTYHHSNTVTLCSNCHRRTHAKEIIFDKKYATTTGKILVHYWVNGEELWKQVNN